MDKKPEDMSIDELKVLHYDLMKTFAQVQTNLQVIENLIEQKEKVIKAER